MFSTLGADTTFGECANTKLHTLENGGGGKGACQPCEATSPDVDVTDEGRTNSTTFLQTYLFSSHFNPCWPEQETRIFRGKSRHIKKKKAKTTPHVVQILDGIPYQKAPEHRETEQKNRRQRVEEGRKHKTPLEGYNPQTHSLTC